MTGRRSARVAAQAGANQSSSQSEVSQSTGFKRKAESESAGKSKRGKKQAEKIQTKLEDSLSVEGSAKKEDATIQGSENTEIADQHAKDEASNNDKSEKDESKAQSNGDHANDSAESKKTVNGLDEIMKKDDSDPTGITPEGTGSKVNGEDSAVIVEQQREAALPSNILEKGIVYFFFRGRVGVENPSDVKDVARSYIVLRPLPQGAALGEGPIGDSENLRLLALPKKVLPESPKDRFLTFVEKSKCTMDEIKERLSSSDYSTKTVGVRHTPSADPIGEGVYAITQTGRETHLAYVLSVPSEVGDVQNGIGLRQRGSYITSAKNPQSKAPANASLPQGAEYPQDILDEFNGRGWMPLQPRLFDYDNTQFLLIGHGDDALEKAAKPQNGDEEKPEKETPLEEIEKLQDEDEHRVKGLGLDHAVFTDLGLSSQEYSKVRTAW